MKRIKQALSELLFLVKNLHKVAHLIAVILKQKLQKLKSIRKFYNNENLNSIKLEYDYIVTLIDGDIFLLNELEYKLYSNSGLVNQKIFFDYHKYSADSINKFLIQHFVKQGDTVIDIGAHIGLYSVFLSKLVESHGKVFCFEPHKNIVKNLENNLILNGYRNFEIHNYGLGDKDEELNFNSVYSDSFFEGTVNSSFLANEKIASKYFDAKFEKIKTKVFKLDSILSDEQISFVKIDTEGFELNILKGMKKIIKNSKPIIIFEFQTKRLQYLAIELHMFDELLTEHYNIFKIFIDIKTNNIAFKKFLFDNYDEYSGDLICLPKISS